MTNEIGMDFGLMEDAIHAHRDGAQRLEDIVSELEHIAVAFEDGILLGLGGEAFSEALRAYMNPAIGRLRDKLEENAQDLQKAMDEFRKAEEENRRRFN